MKKCSRCKLLKEVDKFVKNTAKHDGISTYCKECKSIMDNEYYAKHSKRREQVKTLREAQSKAIVELIHSYKASHPCILCGESDPVVLDFHHKDGDKKYNVSAMRTLGFDTILKEIKKCVVLCANCHRRVTRGTVILPL